MACISALMLAACGAHAPSVGPAKVDIPITDGLPVAKHAEAPKRESPPLSGRMKESPFPAVARTKLGNGMGIAVVTAKTVPVVHAKLLIRAGGGYGSAPGIADLTAAMLKEGGLRAMSSAELLRRVETLGSDLAIRVDADTTTVNLALTKDNLAEGLAILGQVVREPIFDDAELKKLKAREIDETADALRSSGEYTAEYVMEHELYAPAQPYGRDSGLPRDLAKVDHAQIDAFYRKFYVPTNTTLILVGDVDEATATALANKSFGNWAGGLAPKIELGEPKAPPSATRVVVAHRPKSAQSDIFLTLQAPPRHAPEWPQVRVVQQILGGGVGGRLFQDVREQRSLAYRVNATIHDRAHGKQPLALYAGTQTPKTADAVTGLVENLQRMTSSPPTAAETASATRYLSDIFALSLENLGAIADLVARQESLGLAPSYFDDYRKELRATTQAQATDEAAKLYGDADKHALIIVAGDADVIGNDLAKFGEVTVVDPEKDFKTIKTIPAAK